MWVAGFCASWQITGTKQKLQNDLYGKGARSHRCNQTISHITDTSAILHRYNSPQKRQSNMVGVFSNPFFKQPVTPALFCASACKLWIGPFIYLFFKNVNPGYLSAPKRASQFQNPLDEGRLQVLTWSGDAYLPATDFASLHFILFLYACGVQCKPTHV